MTEGREVNVEVPDPPSAEKPRVVVIVASAGRPEVVQDLVTTLESSTITFSGLVCVPDDSDLNGVDLPNCWTRIIGVRGSAAQRNAALDEVEVADYVFFFDDDAVPHPRYIERTVSFFEVHHDYVATTGHVVADGAHEKREISYTDAIEALKAWDQTAENFDMRLFSEHDELYGCNFAIRWADLHNVRFDGRLPLYSWLEDRDYACRVLRLGKIARLSEPCIVHRGVASGGRQAHLRFGYSQVANPLYLRGKGSFSTYLAVEQLIRPVLKNVMLSVVPNRGRAWRRTRLQGNILAVRDLLRREMVPERILTIDG